MSEQYSGWQEKTTSPTKHLQVESILVPIDFSPGAQRALRYAAAFAREVQAKITLLNVVEPLAGPMFDSSATACSPEDVATFARDELLALPMVEDLDPALFNTPVVQSGIAFYEIAKAASHRESDLIILSNHGFAGLQHVWLGSTAAGVVAHAPCPVLLLNGGGQPEYEPVLHGLACGPQVGTSLNATEPFRLRHIIALVESPEAACSILQYASDMAEQFGGSIDILHVLPEQHRWTHLHAIDGTLSEYTLRKQLIEAANREISRRVPLYVEVRTGHAAEQVISFARQRGTNMILLPTDGQTWLQHKMWGRVVERLIREAPCPVLVLPAKGAS